MIRKRSEAVDKKEFNSDQKVSKGLGQIIQEVQGEHPHPQSGEHKNTAD